MASVFAGFVVGYALAILAGGAGAIALIRANERSGVAQRIAPPGTNVLALSVVLHFAAILVLTMIGLLFGMLLTGLDGRRPDGGAGSPNFAYTAIVVATTAVLAIPTLALPAVRRWAWLCALVFAVAFGWAMPWLAKLGA